MKALSDQLSEAVGKQEEDDIKIKEFNVSVYVVIHFSICTCRCLICLL